MRRPGFSACYVPSPPVESEQASQPATRSPSSGNGREAQSGAKGRHPVQTIGSWITRSVASCEGDVHAEASGYLSTQTLDGESILDEPACPRNGFLVGPKVLRGQLISVDAIRPVG